MIKAFTMPKWGIEMTEGRIAEWVVAEGARFAKGTLLATIETDKITNEVEAEADGRFARILARVGETYPVGALLAVLADESDAEAAVEAFVAKFGAPAAAEKDVDAPPRAAPAATAIPSDLAISPMARRIATERGVDVSAIKGSGRRGRITAQDVHQALLSAQPRAPKGPIAGDANDTAFASPMARRLARIHGIALDGVVGSGPRGRIRKADVLALAPAAAAKPSADGAAEIVTMSPTRKAIARRLTEAKATIPHFYLRRRVRADRLMAHRKATGGGSSLNDYLLRACALALGEVPAVNINVYGDEIHRFRSVNIALAVATERGLIAPVVRGAEGLNVAEIGARAKDLIERARAGKLKNEEISGGTFTLSNLGSFGIEQFDAIINPPQGAILAVGSARPEPIDDGGTVRIVQTLHLSLSCDHRAIDGADGARFLSALANLIENPERL